MNYSFLKWTQSIHWTGKKSSISHNRLFACLGFLAPIENFLLACYLIITGEGLQTLTYTRHASMVIEQWEFFSVSHLLWQEISVYNSSLRGPMTQTPVAERIAEELTLPVFSIQVCRGSDSITQISACEANAITNCDTAAASPNRIRMKINHLHFIEVLEHRNKFWYNGTCIISFYFKYRNTRSNKCSIDLINHQNFFSDCQR